MCAHIPTLEQRGVSHVIMEKSDVYLKGSLLSLRNVRPQHSFWDSAGWAAPGRAPVALLNGASCRGLALQRKAASWTFVWLTVASWS